MSASPNFGNFFSFLRKYEDPRTKNWLLVSSPAPTVVIIGLYLYIVKVLGPKLMENRKPFDLRKTIIGYNLFQVALSSWLFYEFCVSGWLTGEYNFFCQPIDRSTDPKIMRMVAATWWYYFSKFTELIETMFFILRKKFSQVNALHVYHHGIMLISSWMAIKYYPSGHGTFPGFFNTFVHVVMYTYYLLSALGPNVQKYLWWKKYLTTFQLIQFVVIMGHNMLLNFSSCHFPRIFSWYQVGLAVSFYVLFRQFYNQTYPERKSKKSNEYMFCTNSSYR